MSRIANAAILGTKIWRETARSRGQEREETGERMIHVSSGGDGPRVFTRDVALQIAAMNPQFVRKDEVSQDVIDREREVLVAKAKETGKPEPVVQKMVDGQISKWLKEICLLDQAWVKDPDKTIDQVQQELIVKIGENIRIRRFVRFELGEGLEKKKGDFADEVAKQAGLA